MIEMLEKSLPREKVAQVDADRMKTTYQMDYSDPGERNKNITEYIVDTTSYASSLICLCIVISVILKKFQISILKKFQFS